MNLIVIKTSHYCHCHHVVYQLLTEYAALIYICV